MRRSDIDVKYRSESLRRESSHEILQGMGLIRKLVMRSKSETICNELRMVLECLPTIMHERSVGSYSNRSIIS